ncbi:hypothetical protein ABZ848_35170 [Streptomyces sp. NPDC047081]|uniref:hypothetical protein n=1 Tax=Streptomyces sp. NPDC047081 TaxID=3154706 RepID=UPI0033EAC5ED
MATAHSTDARYSPFPMDPADVFPMISARMRANARTVVETSGRLGVTPHAAAQRLAEDRARDAIRLRGRIPA